MNTFFNFAGTWTPLVKLFVKNAGLWEDIKRAYVNDGGVWKEVFRRFLTTAQITCDPGGSGYLSTDGTGGSLNSQSDPPAITDLYQFNFGTFAQGGLLKFAGGRLPAPRDNFVTLTVGAVTGTIGWDAANNGYFFGYGAYPFAPNAVLNVKIA